MTSYGFNHHPGSSDGDQVWCYEGSTSGLENLIKRPVKHVTNRLTPSLSPSDRSSRDIYSDPNQVVVQPVQYPDQTVVIVFQYGTFTESGKYWVHGVGNSNIISVRCPAISPSSSTATTEQLEGIKKQQQNSQAAVNVVMLTDITTPSQLSPGPNLGFAHYDPKLTKDIPALSIVDMIQQPLMFPALLNSLNQTTLSCWNPNGTHWYGEGTLEEGWQTLFILSDSFRFRCEAIPAKLLGGGRFGQDSHSADGSVENQCTKFTGSIVTDPGKQLAVMSIDEAWITYWQEKD